MKPDQEIEAQEAEAMTDEQADAEFAALTGPAEDDPKPGDDPNPADKPGDDDPKPTDNAGDDDDPKPSEPGEQKSEADAQAKADAEAKEAAEKADDEKREQAEKAANDAKSKAEADRKAAEEAAAKEQTPADIVTSFVEKHGDAEIPGVDDEGNETTTTFRQFAEEFPGIVQSMAMMIQDMVAPVAAQIKGIEPVIAAQEQAQVDAFRESVFAEVEKAHEDVRDVYASKEFTAWFEKQPPWKQAVADQADPAAVAQAVDWFKADTGQAKKTAAKSSAAAEKAKARKAAEDATGKTTLRSKQSVAAGGGDDAVIDEDEADKMFAEEAKRLASEV